MVCGGTNKTVRTAVHRPAARIGYTSMKTPAMEKSTGPASTSTSTQAVPATTLEQPVLRRALLRPNTLVTHGGTHESGTGTAAPQIPTRPMSMKNRIYVTATERNRQVIKPNRRVPKVAAIGAAAASISAITALAAGGSLNSPFAHDRPVRAHGAISRTLVQHFTVFNRHLSKSSTATFRGRSGRVSQASVAKAPLPGSVSESIHSPYGLVLGGTEYLTVSTLPSVQMWLIPGATGECIVTEGVVGVGVADSVCGSAATAASGRLVKYSWTPSGTPEFIGLAPDGVTTVSVAEHTGEVRSIPVQDNIYAVVGGRPTRIELKGTSGETSIAVTPDPHAPSPAPPSQS